MNTVYKKQYENLIVWKEADQLCLEIYALLPQFPSEERYCLVNQLRRSAYGIPMNIVEGNVKRSTKDKLNFLQHAEGSLDELDYQLSLSNRLGYISDTQYETLLSRVRKVGYLLYTFRSGIIRNTP